MNSLTHLPQFSMFFAFFLLYGDDILTYMLAVAMCLIDDNDNEVIDS
jgi:hypothetical protein